MKKTELLAELDRVTRELGKMHASAMEERHAASRLRLGLEALAAGSSTVAYLTALTVETEPFGGATTVATFITNEDVGVTEFDAKFLLIPLEG